MDYRSCKILNCLLEADYARMDSLAELLHMSERLVRNLIKKINLDLAGKGLPRIQIDSGGSVSFERHTDEIACKVREYILNNDYYTYHLMPRERRVILAVVLLNSSGYKTAAELSDYLEVSRNTVISDLNVLKDWFQKNSILLYSQVQKGYCIQGAEEDIRKGILSLIELNLDRRHYCETEISDTFEHLLLNEFQFQERMEGIRRIVKEEEAHHDLHFSDFSFLEVLEELLVLCKRLSMDKMLTEEVRGSLKNSSKYPLARDILDRLQETFHINIPDNEKKYMVHYLRKKSYIKSSTSNVEKPIIPIMIGEMIHCISKQFNIKFYLDFELYHLLVDHMKSAIYRTLAGEYLENPFGPELEKKYPALFQRVRECAKPLESYMGNSFRPEELSYVAAYFAVMLEQDAMEKRKNQKVRTVLIGGMGRGAMKLMQTAMKQFDDILMISAVKPTHLAPDFCGKEVDLIISMAPYKNDKIPCVQIESPILKKLEVYKIRLMAMEILEKKRKDDGALMMAEQEEFTRIMGGEGKTSFFTKEKVSLEVEAATWEEAVRASGRLLYEAGDVTLKYIEAMVDNVYMNGTYIVICPGLAIPHAEAEKGALKEGMSFVRLKTPICFGNEENDPVTFILGLSILDAGNINEIIYNLMNIFNNTTCLETMNTIQSAEQMYDFIAGKI